MTVRRTLRWNRSFVADVALQEVSRDATSLTLRPVVENARRERRRRRWGQVR